MVRQKTALACAFLVAVSLLAFLPAAGQSATVQATFYVSPEGADANPGTETKPFATVEKARQAVRATNKNMTGDIAVVLRGGTHGIEQTIAFDAADSGTGGHDVIYRAAAKERPVLSGGKRIAGWQPDVGGRWKATANVDDFRQLYVGGRRAIRARGNPPADVELFGENSYRTTAVDMAGWRHPEDMEFCYQVSWTLTRCKVERIEREASHAIITMLQPQFTLAKTKGGVKISKPSYIENALELLDEPGEWYLDRRAKTVYYMPRKGEDLNQVEVIAPAVEKLVELRGTLDQPVHNLRFEGITFADAGWLQPNRTGLVDTQANFIIDETASVQHADGVMMAHNEFIKSPSNVVCRAARSIRFERCTFTRLGGGGLDLEFGSQDNVVSGCRFYDISGTAIQVGDVLRNDHHPDDPRMTVKNNSVVNCYIHDCCVEYKGGLGIFVGYTDGTRVRHNEICRLPYSGISVGWGWGEEDVGGGGYPQPFYYQTPTTAKNNRIEYNHVHHVVQELRDGGAIYTLGNQPGTIIRGNHVHDFRNDFGGIYLDEGSGFIEVTGNLVYRVPNPMFYNNASQDRRATCKVHDNFLGGSEIPKGPEAVEEILESAGLEPAYRDLLR